MTVHTQIRDRLTRSGIRYTPGRRVVVDALADADGPLSAQELGDKLSVPLSSIYRTLATLTDSGVLTPHLSTKGLARYELAEWLTGHHHHLVCTECGSVEDVDPASVHEHDIERIVAAIAHDASFSVTNHALEIEGVCAECR
ncbi:MAG: Fur family transcriptional regulator [Acidimicrobiia bacterium]